MSVALVAMIAGEDPDEAVRKFRSSETAWRRKTCQLNIEW